MKYNHPFIIHFLDVRSICESLRINNNAGIDSYMIEEAKNRHLKHKPLLSTELGLEINQHGWIKLSIDQKMFDLLNKSRIEERIKK